MFALLFVEFASHWSESADTFDTKLPYCVMFAWNVYDMLVYGKSVGIVQFPVYVPIGVIPVGRKFSIVTLVAVVDALLNTVMLNVIVVFMFGVGLSTVMFIIKSTRSFIGLVVFSISIVFCAWLFVVFISSVLVVALKFVVMFPVVFTKYLTMSIVVWSFVRFPIVHIPVVLLK